MGGDEKTRHALSLPSFGAHANASALCKVAAWIESLEDSRPLHEFFVGFVTGRRLRSQSIKVGEEAFGCRPVTELLYQRAWKL